ncbi:MAG: EF-hand domain-containing protein, partial [Planctomycetota bacterium]
LIADLHLLLDDAPLAEHYAAVQSELMRRLNDDGRYQATWNRLFRDAAEMPEIYGNVPRGDDEPGRTRLAFDRNNDGIVQSSELARFVYREARVWNEFRLFGTDAYEGGLPFGRGVFAAIDEDESGRIDLSEMDAAGELILQRYDQNFDGRVTLNECTQAPADVMRMRRNIPPWDSTRSMRSGNVAMDVGERIDWSSVRYRLQEMRRSFDDPRAFGLPGNPLISLDTNDDRYISEEEAAGLRSIDGDIRLIARFYSSAETSPRITIIALKEELQPLQQDARVASAVQLSNQRMQLNFRVADRVRSQPADDTPPSPTSDSGQPATSLQQLTTAELRRQIWGVQFRARAAVVPDSFFAVLDSDNNSVLTGRELTLANSRLSSLTNSEGEIRKSNMRPIYNIVFFRSPP